MTASVQNVFRKTGDFKRANTTADADMSVKGIAKNVLVKLCCGPSRHSNVNECCYSSELAEVFNALAP